MAVYGKSGIKRWICKGEVLEKRDLTTKITAGKANTDGGGDIRERGDRDHRGGRGERGGDRNERRGGGGGDRRGGQGGQGGQGGNRKR